MALHFNPFTSKILLIILLTNCHTFFLYVSSENLVLYQESNLKLNVDNVFFFISVLVTSFFDNDNFTKVKKTLSSSRWRILNNVIKWLKRKASSTLQKQHKNGRDMTNPDISANTFCQYFTNIGPNFASKIS